jgi:transposase
LLDSIPGIDLTAAYAILAEISHHMSAFPTAQHICSWAGLAPGNYESAGKKKKQRVTPGNNYLKTIGCEVAWVIASHKELYLSGWYWRLKQRTNSKKAIVLDFGHFHKRIWNEIEQYFMVCDFQR